MQSLMGKESLLKILKKQWLRKVELCLHFIPLSFRKKQYFQVGPNSTNKKLYRMLIILSPVVTIC